MSGNDWFKRGQEGVDDVKDYEDDRASRASGVFRLWIPAGGSTTFTFLDTEGFFFKEHNYYSRGSWLNWETCIQDIGEDDCPFCEANVRVYYECVFTVIDHARWESKKTPGKIITNTKKLLVLRSTARKKILRKKDQLDGSLTFAKFSTHRDDRKECSTGEDFEFIERLTREQVAAMAPSEFMGQAITPEAWMRPFDYPKLFQPKSYNQLNRALGRVQPVGSGDEPSMSAGEESTSDSSDSPAPSVQSLINK